mmetsp:Transcript_43491/g.136410  ORF Transcript_43491/g.136410 Transcript_43491/m.136410 type:complete len:516 (-) Transcript_43491:813-2360(-)
MGGAGEGPARYGGEPGRAAARPSHEPPLRGRTRTSAGRHRHGHGGGALGRVGGRLSPFAAAGDHPAPPRVGRERVGAARHVEPQHPRRAAVGPRREQGQPHQPLARAGRAGPGLRRQARPARLPQAQARRRRRVHRLPARALRRRERAQRAPLLGVPAGLAAVDARGAAGPARRRGGPRQLRGRLRLPRRHHPHVGPGLAAASGLPLQVVAHGRAVPSAGRRRAHLGRAVAQLRHAGHSVEGREPHADPGRRRRHEDRAHGAPALLAPAPALHAQHGVEQQHLLHRRARGQLHAHHAHGAPGRRLGLGPRRRRREGRRNFVGRRLGRRVRGGEDGPRPRAQARGVLRHQLHPAHELPARELRQDAQARWRGRVAAAAQALGHQRRRGAAAQPARAQRGNGRAAARANGPHEHGAHAEHRGPVARLGLQGRHGAALALAARRVRACALRRRAALPALQLPAEPARPRGGPRLHEPRAAADEHGLPPAHHHRRRRRQGRRVRRRRRPRARRLRQDGD